MAPDPSERKGQAAPTLALSLGFFSLAMQALFFREHALAYSGNEVGTSLFLASWLAWNGLGALLAKPLFRSGSQRPLLVALLLYAPVSVAELFGIWHLRQWAGLSATDLFPMDQLAWLTLVVTAPFSLLTGVLFVGVTEVRRQAPQVLARWNVGQLFSVEALGGVVGGALVTLALWLEMPTNWLYLLLLGLWCFTTATALLFRGDKLHWLIQSSLLVLLAAWSLLGAPNQLASWRLDSLQLSEQYEVVDDFDTAESHVTVARFRGATALFTDGQLSAVYPDSGEARLLAALLASALPAGPRAVLILGQEQEPLVCELARMEGWSVTWVHSQRELHERMQRHLPGDLRECLASPAVHVIMQQPVDFLTGDRSLYDLIALEFPDPTSSAASRFLTPEFLRLTAGRLSATGLVTMDMPLPPADVGQAVTSYVGAAWATFAHVFPRVSMAAGQGLRFWATVGGLVPATAEQTLAGFAAVKSQFPELLAEHLLELFEASRTQEWRTRLGALSGLQPFEESRPSSYLYHLRVVERDSHLLALLARPSSEHVLPFLLALATFLASWLIWGVGRRGRPLRLAGLQIPVAGFAGMVCQMVLLLLFQFRHGDLHLHFALLNGAYMLGLALSGASTLLVDKLQGVARRWVVALGGIAALAACLCGILALLAWPWGAPGLVTFVLASTVVGAGSGVALVLASAELSEQDPAGPTAASWFQSLDSLGAVAGALVAGLVWIPSLGFAKVLGMLALLTVSVGILQLLSLLGWLGGTVDRMVPEWSEPHTLRPWLPGVVTRRLLFWMLLLVAGAQLLSTGSTTPESLSEGTQLRRMPPVTAPAGGPQTVFTSEYAAGVNGYGGPLDLQLSVDANERVTALALHRHTETPEYLGDLQPFLADFLGKEAPLVEYGQPDKPNGIHAMTGATVTGQAVVESVRRTGAALRLKRLEVARSATQAQEALSAAPGVESDSSPSPWMHWKVWLVALLGLTGVALYFFATKRWRLVYLILVLAVCGVYLNAQVTLSESLRLLGSPSPLGNPLLVVGVGALLLGVLLAGPLFCGYLCPFGALQELLSGLGLRWRVALPLERRLRRVKYLVAAVALLASLLVGLDRAFRFDPLTYAFSYHWDGLALLMLLLLLAGTLVWFRPWCRYLCPLGALCSLGEKLGVATCFAPTRNYGRCHLGVDPTADLDCIRCNLCVSQRQPRARHWNKAWSQRLLGAFVLLALLLGLARILWVPPSPATTTLSPQVVPPSLPSLSGSGPQGSAEGSGPSEPQAASSGGPEKSGEPVVGSLLQRGENAQHPEQRDVNLPVLLEKIRNSEASSKEALFYQPVP